MVGPAEIHPAADSVASGCVGDTDGVRPVGDDAGTVGKGILAPGVTGGWCVPAPKDTRVVQRSVGGGGDGVGSGVRIRAMPAVDEGVVPFTGTVGHRNRCNQSRGPPRPSHSACKHQHRRGSLVG